jgi:hypothetical protein
MRVNGQHERAVKIWLMAGACFALALIMVFSVPESALCGSTNDLEAKAVLKAARKFLDAEVRRDYPAVYACFAPSSPYGRSNSYEQYLAQAKLSPDQVVAYRIVRISYIQNPEDRKTYPSVDKVAQVEVDVTYLHPSTQRRSEINIGFVFLKEGGRWYKS